MCILMSSTLIIQLTDLDFIINDDIYLSGSSLGFEKEVYHNFWQISFDQDVALKLKKSDLEKFFDQLLEKRFEQIDAISKDMPVTFYMWVDEMSTQICFDFISGKNPILPFGCKLNMVADQNIIVDQYLKSLSCGGVIPYEEIVFYEKGDPEFDDIDDDDYTKNYVLDVYAVVVHGQKSAEKSALQDVMSDQMSYIIEKDTPLDRQSSFEIMQIFLDSYCQKNHNLDLINLVKNSRKQHSNHNFSFMPDIIEPRIWQIWQQAIYRTMLQEGSKVIDLLIAFHAMGYF